MNTNAYDKVLAAITGVINYIQPGSTMTFQQLDSLIVEAASELERTE